MKKMMICNIKNCPRSNIKYRNNCEKYADTTNCSAYRREPESFYPLCTDAIQKVIPKYGDNTYTFRGPLNLTHLTNNCIKHNRNAFLTISADKCIFGFSRLVEKETCLKLITALEAVRQYDTYLPFHIFETDKHNINILMSVLKNIEALVKKQKRKSAKKLFADKQKGKFSNKPETKVMTF